MENLYEIIGSLLGTMLVAVLAYLAPKAREWLSANADDATEEAVLRLVRSFVRAAEQTLRAEDPTGEVRHEYVMEQLRRAGVEITETVLSMIEGEVWDVNQAKASGSAVTTTAGSITAVVSGR